MYLRFMGPYIAILCHIPSFGSLAGSPIAGALLRGRHHNTLGASDSYRPEDFHSMMWFTGTIWFAAGIFYQLAGYKYAPRMLIKV